MTIASAVWKPCALRSASARMAARPSARMMPTSSTSAALAQPTALPLHPRVRARRYIRPLRLRHQLRIAQPLGDPPAGAALVHHGGADGDRSGERPSADLVARDDDRPLAQQAPLEGEPGGRRGVMARWVMGGRGLGPARLEHLVMRVDATESVQRPGDDEGPSDDVGEGHEALARLLLVVARVPGLVAVVAEHPEGLRRERRCRRGGRCLRPSRERASRRRTRRRERR